MSQLQLFPPFDPDYEPDSVGLRWVEYKRDFEHFMVASNGKKFAEICKEIKTSSFIYLMGRRCATLFRTVGKDTDSYEDICSKMDKIFVKSVNTDYEKYKFSLAKQAKNEPFDAFVNRLRVLSANCNFADAAEEIRTRIIHGCYSEQLRVKALSEGLNAENLIKTGRALEQARNQAHLITETETINAVKFKGKYSSRNIQENKNSQNFHPIKSSANAEMIKCKYCGKEHILGKSHCPAYGKKCNKCKAENHFAIVCQSKEKQSVHCVTTRTDDCYSRCSCGRTPDLKETSPGSHSFRTNIQTNTAESDYIFSINTGKRDPIATGKLR